MLYRFFRRKAELYGMPYNEMLASRIREVLSEAGANITAEKKMFGAIAFMLNSKMAVTAGKDRMMCRIDPALHEPSLKKKGVTNVVMRGKKYPGFIHISEAELTKPGELRYWVTLAMEFNQQEFTGNPGKE